MAISQNSYKNTQGNMKNEMNLESHKITSKVNLENIIN